MCGDFEEDDLLDDHLFNRFLELAQHLGVQPSQESLKGHLNLNNAQEREQYMSELFNAGLLRSVNDVQFVAKAGEKGETLAIQAIVFARLAGFLAAQLPPESNMMRALMEATLDGSGDAQQQLHDWEEHGHHHHHHSHDQGHSH